MKNKKALLLFLALFVGSAQAVDEGGAWGFVGRVFSAFEREARFGFFFLPLWHTIYAPFKTAINRHGQQALVINNRLSARLVACGLWGDKVPQGLDAAARYSFIAAPHIAKGKWSNAAQDLAGEVLTDGIVTSAALLIPTLGEVLNIKLHPTLPASLDLVARVAVRSYVVDKYILSPTKQEDKVTFEQQAKAFGMAIERYEKTLDPDVLKEYQGIKNNPVCYLRQLELCARSTESGTIRSAGASYFGFEPIEYSEALKSDIKIGDFSSDSGKPYLVCITKTKA